MGFHLAVASLRCLLFFSSRSKWITLVSFLLFLLRYRIDMSAGVWLTFIDHCHNVDGRVDKC